MAVRGSQFPSSELVQVLSRYDIGRVHQLTPLRAGNGRAGKAIIRSEKGTFFLKRRPSAKTDLERLKLSHAVQTYLAEKEFAVSGIVETAGRGGTFVQVEDHLYELFAFVTGSRYDGSPQATAEAARQLARLHGILADFSWPLQAPTTSFHDSSVVRRQLKAAGSRKTARPSKELSRVTDTLSEFYNAAAVRVNEQGFDNWPRQIVHGDWHPGNMLFDGPRLVAVLDFDSVRLAPTVTDLANGMLQFSIVGGRPHPADWPAYLDHTRLAQFADGYRRVRRLPRQQLSAVTDLMVEAMITEAIVPIAATGLFGNLSGVDFLKMIHRKVDWLVTNRERLNQLISG